MSKQNEARRRVLIVGLDGATFDVILPMVERQRLPALRALLEGGAWGELTSTLPPVSPVAWPSFLTGKNPGRHGVFGFEEIEGGSYTFRPIVAQRSAHRSLWRMAGDHGRRVIALDIPFSYPPEPVNGCLVAGYGAPTCPIATFTYPASLRDDLARRFGEFAVAVPSMAAVPPSDALFQQWDAILDNRSRVADWLIRNGDWDVFMIVLGVTDHIQHGTWTYYDTLHPNSRSPEAPRFREALFRYYEKADAFVGRLLDSAGGPLHVVVLSDHGFGTTWRGDLTRRVLVEGGWLNYRGWSRLGARIIDVSRRTYDGLPWLKKALHGRPAQRQRLKRAVARAIDWRRTAAFPAALGWQVHVNCRGVFPLGLVERGDARERLCGEIKERLEAVVAPGSAQRLIRRVWRRNEVFQGESTALAPDLLVEYANLYGLKPDSDGPNARLSTRRWDLVGSHVVNGILIMSGPDIRPMRLEGARIYDVAPTVLHLMGLPVPDDLDGRVLSEVFHSEALESRPVRRQRAVATSDKAAQDRPLLPDELASVRDQLRNLGYVD